MTDFASLIKRVREVGQRLTLAQPKELAVGNIVRRVLGVIRLEAEENRDGDASNTGSESHSRTPNTLDHDDDDGKVASSSSNTSSPLRHNGPAPAIAITSDSGDSVLDNDASSSGQPQPPTQSSAMPNTDRPLIKSMFSLLSHPASNTTSPAATPGSQTPTGASLAPGQSLSDQHATPDLGAEVGEAIGEIIEELETADDQIAGYALDHIHSSETVLTYASSITVQKFLLKAAAKRKFTVIHAEAFPNNHEAVHATMTGSLKGNADDIGPDRFHKSLTTAGITVILIPDAAIYAVMSRVNKVILSTQAVLANGGFIAAAGARLVAKAASVHRTPVVVLSGIYKLSPIHPFDTEAFIEYGDSSKIVPYEDGAFMEKVYVENPLYDYVPPELIDLYVTNL